MNEGTVRRIVREELARAVDALGTESAGDATSTSVVAFAATVPPGEYRASALYDRFRRWWEQDGTAGPCPSVTMFGRRVRADPRVLPRRKFSGRWYVVTGSSGQVA